MQNKLQVNDDQWFCSVSACISGLYPTAEVNLCNDAVKCSFVSRDLDFVFAFFILENSCSQQQVQQKMQSSEILGVL